jgi:hypothetical protein
MELNWRKNREPDLLGYFVYRRRPEEREFKRLNESPLAKENYLDTDVVLKQEFEYVVTAVDNSKQKTSPARKSE